MAEAGGWRRPAATSPVITALVTALVAIGSFSTSVYIPSLPTLAAEFQTTPDRVKLTLALFLAGLSLGQLLWGPLSDRFGRRPLLLAGLAVYLAGTIACLEAPSIDAMLAARFLQGFGGSVGQVLGRAVIRDSYDRAGAARVFGLVAAAMAVSPALGPAIGGHLHVWFGWRANFVLMSALGAILVFGVWRLLAETNRAPDPGAAAPARILRTYAHLLGERRLVGHLFCAGLIFGGLSVYIAMGPFILVGRLGVTPETFGYLTVATTAAYVTGSLSAARLAPRLGTDILILVGAAICLCGGLAMAALSLGGESVARLLLPMGLFAGGMGLALPSALAGGLAPFPERAGAASALLGCGQMGLAALATVAAGFLPTIDSLSLGLVLAALGLAAVASRLVLVRGR